MDVFAFVTFEVFVVFIIIVLYVISMINRFGAKDIPQTAKYIDANDMNTGDILCVAYNNLAGAFVGSFTNSVWVHTGMVWVEPETEIRYVLEGAIYRQTEYKHFFKIPVNTWLNINRGSLMGYKKYFGPEIDAKKMIETFVPFERSSELEGFNPFWIRFLMTLPYYEKIHSKKYTCFECTVILGQENGIFKKNRYYSSYFPTDIINNKIDFCKGVSYSPVEEVVLNPIETSLLLNDVVRFPSFWKNCKSKKKNWFSKMFLRD